MNDRKLLRFDTVVAICALLASSIAAGAMVYQTRVIADQFSATVWPYLGVVSAETQDSFSLRLANDGMGPALIRSANLWVDGKPAAAWNQVFRIALAGVKGVHGARASLQFTGIGPSMTIRAGDSRLLMSIATKAPRIIPALRSHTITVAFCYCSINGKCWRMKDTADQENQQMPQPVNGCGQGSSIEAALKPF